MSPPSLLMKLLILSLFAAFASSVGFAQTSSYQMQSSAHTEVFTTKVLKKYQAQSEQGAYVAYVVEWRGQEVIVVPTDSPDTKTEHAVGDTITCMANVTTRTSAGKNETGKLKFYLGSPTGVPDEAARLDLIAAEVRKRRLLREGMGPKEIASDSSKGESKK